MRRVTSADVIDFFGDRHICDRCNASISTYGDSCTAPLDDRCPGFEAYDDMLLQVTTALQAAAKGDAS